MASSSEWKVTQGWSVWARKNIVDQPLNLEAECTKKILEVKPVNRSLTREGLGHTWVQLRDQANLVNLGKIENSSHIFDVDV